jgi:hypothetical protein
MTPRTAAWLAWTLAAVVLLLAALTLLLIFLGWSTPLPKGWQPWAHQAIDTIGFIGAPLLGGLIASRRPENPYGWLWIGFGLGFTLATFTETYAAYALVVEPGSLPAPRMVGGPVGAEGFVLWITLLSFILLLFPDGRLPSRRWRFLAWSVVAVGAVLVVLGPLVTAPADERFLNPIGVGGAAGEVIRTLGFGGVLALFGAVILSALSLVFRYRRAAGVERQQIKWFAYAAALVGGYTVLSFFLPDLLNALLGNAVALGLYGAVGVAILKYRLYDIDVLINRTLVYGSLTATLVALYFGGIVVLQRVFVALTGEKSTLAVVASTLLIAALFSPMRRGIQSLIDGHFYRRKYDARKTLESFSTKLRDETDLEALNDELVGVVRKTMQPEHVSLWLRSPTEVGRGGESSE